MRLPRRRRARRDCEPSYLAQVLVGGLSWGEMMTSLLAARIDNRLVRLENNRLLSARIQQRAIRENLLWWKSELNLRLALADSVRATDRGLTSRQVLPQQSGAPETERCSSWSGRATPE